MHRNALVARRAIRTLEFRADADGAESWAVSVAPLGEWLVVSRRCFAAVREAVEAAGADV